MKAMVISDIHGNSEALKEAINKYNIEGADKLIILGDFGGYFHSSEDYEVAEILNNMAGVIVAVQGNCDSDHLKEIFNFDLSYLKNIIINDISITITHGHIYNITNLPNNCGRIFLFGHTHCGMLENQKTRIFGNPGSISKPRGGTVRSYIIIDEEKIILKSLKGETIKQIKL